MSITTNETVSNKPGRLTKVNRYKWTIADEPGTFLMIPKDQLKIDPSYQRHGNNRRAVGYAAKWSWIACGALIVADRDNEFYVMDGQHRKLAADKRADIHELPCIVFRVEGMDKEAQGFLDVNSNRRALMTLDKFNALIATSEPLALHISKLAEASGLRIVGGPARSSVRCVGVLMTMARYDRDALDRVFPLAAQLCDGAPLSGPLISGLWWLERHGSAPGFSLSRNPWRSRLLKKSLAELNESMSRARAYYVKGSFAVFGRGIANAINKGASVHKITVNESKDDEE